MRRPERPPAFDHILGNSPELLRKMFALLQPGLAGRYFHWEQLKWRTPPEGNTHQEWWASLKIAREAARRALPWSGTEGEQASLVLTDEVLKRLHQLDRSLGGPLGAAEPGLTNQATRDRFIVLSLMDEAVSSSVLEGAMTTRKEGRELLATGREPSTHAERMVHGNWKGMELVRQQRAAPLTLELLLELHTAICAESMPEENVGRLRRSDESVVVMDHGSGEVLHVPPPADELVPRLEALCAFANADDEELFLHPVLRAIALHFALAYEHPFVDGNGRVARAAFYWSLLHSGYWIGEFLSISTVLQKAPAQYAESFLLCETDGLDLTYFVLHQLEALDQALGNLRAWISRKQSEVHAAEKQMRGRRQFNHRQRDLLADALKRPGGRISIETHQRMHSVVYQTARTDLLQLARLGLLKKVKEGRAFLFEVPEDFAQRLKSRT
jgi:Fic family protein